MVIELASISVIIQTLYIYELRLIGRPKMKTIIRKRASSKKYIQLKCDVSGGPILHVDWYKDGRVLKLYGKTSWIDGVEYQKGKHGLKINRSNTKGSGNYTCFAWNMAGEILKPSSEVTIYGLFFVFLLRIARAHIYSSSSCQI